MELTVKVNNQASSPVRVVDGRPIVSWDFEEVERIEGVDGDAVVVEVYDQSSYELRIGTSSAGQGTGSFSGNLVSTGLVSSKSRQYAYDGPRLTRGETYYGQVRVYTELSEDSGWQSFSFRYNALPSVSDVAITPSSPSTATPLTLTYSFFDADGDEEGSTHIRWFRNGSHVRDLDNSLTVDVDRLDYDDVWFADIVPNDGYEYGRRSTSSSVTVSTTAAVASGLYISPPNANENDILTANYVLTATESQDESTIRWYVNDALQPSANNKRHVRLPLEEGDRIRFELIPSDGETTGTLRVSETITIQPAPFVVRDIRVDGRMEPLDQLSLRPIISWRTMSPPSKTQRYVAIKIGTYWGGNDVHEEEFESNQTTYQVPPNLLKKGSDYFVSIAVGEEPGPDHFACTHFRTAGSRWAETASNSVGWTVELSFQVDPGAEYDSAKYQALNIQDGSKFAEVRIYRNRIGLLTSSLTLSDEIDLSGLRAVTVAGKGSDVKVYLDRTLLIDGSGNMTISSSSKKLSLASNGLTASYRCILYTTEGDYHPGSSSAYADIAFFTTAYFKRHELTGVKGIVSGLSQYNVVGVNPHDENKGGAIYKVMAGDSTRYEAVSRTYTPINSIAGSPDGRFTALAHARGASLFQGYPIPSWDYNLDLAANNDPKNNGWELVSNIIGEAGFFDGERWRVDTTFERFGKRQIEAV